MAWSPLILIILRPMCYGRDLVRATVNPRRGSHCHPPGNRVRVKVSIRVGVSVEVQPMDQFVSAGEVVLLTCNVSGSEPISYQWLKDGQSLNGSTDRMLMFTVSFASFGEYQCNASNDVNHVLSEVAVVHVSPEGSVTVSPFGIQTLSVNGSVTFTCMAQGGPSNVFQWSLDGVYLPGENGTMLSVTGVDAADGGTYTCTVSNAAGMDQASALLRVNPILLEEPVDTNISLFEDEMLICRARGFPAPEVLWYQNSVCLDAAALGNVNITAVMMSRITTSTLTITNATFDNSGRYFCSVTSSDPNVISVNSSEVDVIVQPNLMDPVGFTVMIVDPSPDSDPVTAIFSWTALDNVTFGGQDITYTVTVSYQNGSEVVSQSIPHPRSSLETPGLPACANLTATLVAERGSESSNGTVDQFMTSEPTDPTNVEIDGMMSDYLAGSNISLQCSWDTSVYYMAWYKNGMLIYEKDLAASSALMGPPQGISVDSNFTTMMSTLTIANAALDDSGNYTCAVTCGAKGVEFGMIAGNLQDTAEVFVYEPPSAPNGLEVVIKADNTAPVTAVISWMPLMGSATGIPPRGNQTLRYFVKASNSSSAVLFSTTVEHPTNMAEATNLPACETLAVSVTAENLFFNRTTANKDFMTVEPADPVVTLTPDVDPLEGNATDNVTLTCTWNSTVFYLVWFKDGAPLYSRDLVSGDTVDSTSASVSVEVEGLSSTLTISQVSDSGNYTCAVTCRAKDSAEEDIPVQFRATKEVLIFDEPANVVGFAARVGFLSVTFTWTLPLFLGVPRTLDPADFIVYILDVRNGTDSVGGATVPHPTTTVVVNLTYPCEEYTATIFARNRQAGNGPPTMEMFTLNETSAVNVSLSPTEDPVTYLFRAAGANNTIMLSCSWDAEVYYVAWLRNGAPFYREDRVRGLQLEKYGSFSGTASVITNFAARSSTLQVTDAFITDSANYTCAVTCRARQVVRGEVLVVSEEFSATREVLVLAVPVGLIVIERRPTYLVVRWTAPPSPFSGNYRLTYGPLGGMMTTITVSGVSLDVTITITITITGLQPFTNYRVTVQASSAPVVDYGPTLSGVFPTLPEAVIPPGVDPPTAVVPQVGDGSSGIVEIIIPSPPFDRQDLLSHLWVVCIMNILPTTRNTAPDTAFPDNSTFGTYDNAEDNVPYVASEFDAAGIDFPYTFGVGDESEPNDFPNQYRNGPVMAGRNLDCFVRYFVSTEVMPMARRRRDAIPNRQYDIFLSTGYISVTTIRDPANNDGLIAGLVVMFVLLAVILAATIAVILVILYCKRMRHDKGNLYENDMHMEFMVINNPSTGPRAVVQETVLEPAKPAIPVKRFPRHVTSLHVDSNAGFAEEYQMITAEAPVLAHDVAKLGANQMKNRYINIMAADHSRVVLPTTNGNPLSDYINGNFIDGYSKDNEYIATQGPLVSTEEDFWRMVWNQNTRLIVMLTNLVEKGRVKCHQYWPEQGSTSYGDIKVTCSKEQTSANVCQRTFVVTKGYQTHEVVQLHYLAWPDYGVPNEVFPIFNFIDRMKMLRAPEHGPTIVHCSAGVGRTGTLIAIATMMEMIAEREEINVFSFVMKMRANRNHMVQTEKQYTFIHDALVEFIKSRSHLVTAAELKTHVTKMATVSANTNMTGFQQEYQALENIETVDDTKRAEGLQMENYLRNRFPQNIPYDEHRVKMPLLPHKAGSDYYPAVSIHGYNEHEQFILAEGPMEITNFDFLRLIWEAQPSAIVMLCNLEEDGKEQCAQYWPGNSEGLVQVGAYLMQVETEVVKENGLVLREVTLTNLKEDAPHKMKFYHYPNWPHDSLPRNTEDFFKLIGNVLKSQKMYGGGPILVHDSGSTGRSATFCAVANILECLKAEGAVDIFRVIREIRMRQPHAVDREDLYQFCYTAALGNLSSFDRLV